MLNLEIPKQVRPVPIYRGMTINTFLKWTYLLLNAFYSNLRLSN